MLFADRQGKTKRTGAARAYELSGVASQRLCSITLSAFCVSTSAEYCMGWWGAVAEDGEFSAEAAVPNGSWE